MTERQGISRNQTNQFRKAPKPLQPGAAQDALGLAPGQGRGDASWAWGCHRRPDHDRAATVACPALGGSVMYLLHINQKFTNLGASTIIFTFFTFFHIFTPAWRPKQQPEPRKTCWSFEARPAVPSHPPPAPRAHTPPRASQLLSAAQTHAGGPALLPKAPAGVPIPAARSGEIRTHQGMRNSNRSGHPLLSQGHPGDSQHHPSCQLGPGKPRQTSRSDGSR